MAPLLLLLTLTALGVMSVVGGQSNPTTSLTSQSISVPAPTAVEPTSVSNDTPSNATGSVLPLAARLTGFDGCKDPQFIKDAFTEFERMVPLERNSANNEYFCEIASRSIVNHRITAVTLGSINTRGRILPGPVVPPWTSLGL